MGAEQHAFYVVPTVHPAFALRDRLEWAHVIASDIKRAERIAATGWRYEPKVTIGLPRTDLPYDDALALVTESLRGLDFGPQAQPIAVDTETTGVDQHACALRAVAVSQVGTLEALAFPYSASVWGTQGLAQIHRALAAVLASGVPKLAHNWCFDYEVLHRHGFPISGPLLDTLVAHHNVESGLPHDLGFVAQRWLDVDPWKRSFDEQQKQADRKWADADWLALLYYNARDALEAGRLWPVLYRALQEHSEKALELFWFHMWEVDLALRMSRVGLPVNEDARRQTSKQLHEKRDTATAVIRETMQWPDFNPRRPVHKRELLYTRLQLPVRKFTKETRQPSTSYKAIVEHADLTQVRALMDYDEAASLLSNVVDKYAGLTDGRLHVTWNTTGTDGSRLSSSPNLQNWPIFPVNVRSIVRAPAGRCLVYADYDQLEYRILAAFAGAVELLRVFRSGADPHAFIARQVFGRAFDLADPRTRKALRTLAKRVVYAMNYGAGSRKVHMTLIEDKRLDREVRALLAGRKGERQVTKIMNTFFDINPEVLVWREATLDQVNTHGFLTIPPLGRTRRFLAQPVDGPKAWNWPIQVCGHDYLLLAMWRVDQQLPANANIIVDGHDAMLVECDEADVDYTKQLVESAMHAYVGGPAGNVALTATAKAGTVWGELG